MRHSHRERGERAAVAASRTMSSTALIAQAVTQLDFAHGYYYQARRLVNVSSLLPPLDTPAFGEGQLRAEHDAKTIAARLASWPQDEYERQLCSELEQIAHITLEVANGFAVTADLLTNTEGEYTRAHETQN